MNSPIQECVWRPGSNWTGWGSLQHSPDPLAAFGEGREVQGVKE